MSGKARDRQTENVASAVATAQEAAARGAEYATERISDITRQGQRVAHDVDQHLADHTGRSSAAWVGEGARLIKRYPWRAVAGIAVVAYLLGRLRG